MIIRADARAIPLRDSCVQCVVTSPPYWRLRDYGDTRQIGLERTPDEYVEQIVAVFREIWRVLRGDGVAWLNLGDTYARDSCPGMKPKDLVGIPWRVAFALQADGWCLRSDVIWHKPNPFPDGVKDRPTKAHEYVFLLTKGERYYYDAEAIAEPASTALAEQIRRGYHGKGQKDYARAGVQNPSDVKARIIKRRTVRSGIDTRGGGQGTGVISFSPLTRNKRSVWTIPTQPYEGAHFATMPEALIEPCVLASTRPGDLVLDPFVGSGTVARVAYRLGRRAIGLEIHEPYLPLAVARSTGLTYGLPMETSA